jgi:glycosyltransferase involved in cell wall biosynthesis
LSKIAVYHFNNGSGGGVFTVIKNLFRFSSHPAIENHIIYTINQDKDSNYLPVSIEGAKTETVFYYSPRANFHYTCKALSKLIPNPQAVLVAHDWLELGMVSHLGLQNPVVNFLHGDYNYYYELATAHQTAIDNYVAIASSIALKLKAILTTEKENIYYFRFPVPFINAEGIEKNSKSIAFVGRLSASKGYPLLSAIDDKLRNDKINLTWHIAGDIAKEEEDYRKNWSNKSDTVFYGCLSNDDILQLLNKMEYFILPSLHEGMPVSIVEAMKAGVIPLVNDIDGGIQELIEDGVTGYKINGNNPIDYASKIRELATNVTLRTTVRNNCIERATLWFNPIENTRRIEDQISKLYASKRRFKAPKTIYGSRLDKTWIPNWITKTVRSL